LAKIIVTLKKSILDPQGKTVHHALESLGMDAVSEVRIGKFIEIKINANNEIDAHKNAEEASKKLLANPVMEDYSFTIEKL
jgi:phosphoribosylformylglycinamidine synthase PurS subunit